MKDVGDKFGAGELILPFVLQSAEVMKKAVQHLEKFLEKSEGYTKGRVVLATVYGDVHDIGKSLVNTILSNNGYTVYDLGKQVPVNTIIEKAVEVNADAIGLSALLVSTSKQMPLCVQELDKRGIHIPVMIGGAAINRRFGRRAMFVDGERAYDAGVFYCKDAFEGLDTMDVLQDDARKADFVEKLMADAHKDIFLHAQVGKDTAAGTDSTARSDVAADNPIPNFILPKGQTTYSVASSESTDETKAQGKQAWDALHKGKSGSTDANGNPVRKYLTEPPVDYREPDPNQPMTAPPKKPFKLDFSKLWPF